MTQNGGCGGRREPRDAVRKDDFEDPADSPLIRDDKRDRLKQLRSFCYAARLRSISKAANHVHTSQPAVSLQIRALEERIGVALFERYGPRLELTDAGKALYAQALPLVEGLDRFPDAFAEQFRDLAGILRIGASETAASSLLPGRLKAFKASHGDIRISTRIGRVGACLEWLRGHEVDIVFASMDVPVPDLDFQMLVASPYVLITPEGHPLALLERAGPRDLHGHPQIANPKPSDVRAYEEMHQRRHGVTPDVVVDVDGWEAIKACVEAGIGIAVVPGLCLGERDRVHHVPYEGALSARNYGYITRRERVVPLAVQKFIHVLASSQDSEGGAYRRFA